MRPHVAAGPDRPARGLPARTVRSGHEKGPASGEHTREAGGKVSRDTLPMTSVHHLPTIAEADPQIPAEDEAPAWTWDAWTDEDRWELGPVEDGPDPSWDAPSFEPEPIAAAYQLGYELGLAGEYPSPPAHLSEREAFHFNAGRLAGFIASPDGVAWYRDLETLEDRPADADGVHQNERLGVC